MTARWGTTETPELPKDDIFTASVSAARPEPLRPPTQLLAGALVTALIAWLLGPLTSQMTHLVGWALGSLGTLGFLTAYSAVDVKRAQTTLYAALPAAARLRAGLIMAGFAAGVFHAYFFARAVAS